VTELSTPSDLRPLRSERDLRILRGFAQRIDAGDAGAHNNLGVLYFNKGLYEEAVQEFHRALEIDPKMQVAQRNLEIAFFNTGYYDRLIRELRELLREDPTDVRARRRLAQAYLHTGDVEGSVAELRRVLGQHPDDLQTLIGLGQAEKAGGNFEAAMGWFRQAQELDSDSAVLHFYIGELYYNRGLSEEAREELLRAVELNPMLADAHYVLAFVHGDLGDTAAAAESSRRATQLNPQLTKAQTNLSLDRYSTARYQEMVGNRVRRPEVAAGGYLAHYNLGIAFRQKGLYDEALRELVRALDGGEDGALVRQAMAEVYLLQGDATAALDLYDRLLSEDEGSPKLWNERGVCLHQSGQVQAAEENYLRSVRSDATYALAWNNLGVARLHRGEPGGAEAAFAEAVRLRGDFADVRLNQGLMLLRRGKHNAALEAYRAALAARPHSAPAWCGVGSVLLETRRYEEARNAFARAVEADPDLAEARYNLSFVLSNLGDFEGALRETKRALELNPYFTQPRYKLSIELQFEYAEVLAPELDAAERVDGEDTGVESFTFDEAALDAIFNEIAPARPPEEPDVRTGATPFALVQDYLSKGLLERALVEIRRAGVAGADPVEAALLTADIYTRQGLDGEALERYDAAIARLEGQTWGPEHTRACLGRARALLRLGRAAEARDSAETAGRHAPGDAETLRILGEALLRLGEPRRAMGVFQTAREALPQDPGLLRSLGTAALAAGLHPEAEHALREAIALDGGFVSARVELARLLLEDGRVESAADEARAALEILPTLEEAVLLLAEAERCAARFGPAVAALVDLLESDPYQLEALLLLGRVLLEEGRRADARRALTRVLRFDAGSVPALYYLGVVFAEERLFREAIDLWRRALEDEPEGPFAARARENIATALDLARIFQLPAAAGTRGA
jgi:cellulose synthase operon protein C